MELVPRKVLSPSPSCVLSIPAYRYLLDLLDFQIKLKEMSPEQQRVIFRVHLFYINATKRSDVTEGTRVFYRPSSNHPEAAVVLRSSLRSQTGSTTYKAIVGAYEGFKQYIVLHSPIRYKRTKSIPLLLVSEVEGMPTSVETELHQLIDRFDVNYKLGGVVQYQQNTPKVLL